MPFDCDGHCWTTDEESWSDPFDSYSEHSSDDDLMFVPTKKPSAPSTPIIDTSVPRNSIETLNHLTSTIIIPEKQNQSIEKSPDIKKSNILPTLDEEDKTRNSADSISNLNPPFDSLTTTSCHIVKI